jgi:Uncharacterized protein conserved in bacteria (DUF2252)
MNLGSDSLEEFLSSMLSRSSDIMDIHSATHSYEKWLGGHTKLIAGDLARKHDEMAGHVFPFLRATFYAWLELWAENCPELQDAPRVLAVADLHVENFGSWRDGEGRLVWGINDFDEADVMPYTNDLVRLATSALLAAEIAGWSLSPKSVCDSILEGYTEGLEKGGEPFVLDERHRWFVPMMHKGLRDPVRFWQRMRELPEVRAKSIPHDALTALKSLLPEPSLECRYARRTAGLGSLGRQRYVALAEWRGGLIAREAKALTPSACLRSQSDASRKLHYEEILRRAVRCPDPFVRAEGNWIVRRLAPDCAKIELSSLSRVKEEVHQLRAMGWETANVHLGSRDAAGDVHHDLRARPRKWLRSSALRMLDVTEESWRDWRAGMKRGSRASPPAETAERSVKKGNSKRR